MIACVSNNFQYSAKLAKSSAQEEQDFLTSNIVEGNFRVFCAFVKYSCT